MLIMNFDKKLIDDITEYCNLNDLILDDVLNELLQIGFNIIRFGSSPHDKIKQQLETKLEQTIVKTEQNFEQPKKNIRIIKNK